MWWALDMYSMTFSKNANGAQRLIIDLSSLKRRRGLAVAQD